MSSLRLALPALALALLLGACEGHVRHGSALYADGRYIEAAEVFERTEHRLPQFTARERADYGLYRGMTLLVLGDLKGARQWLGYAYEVERRGPGSLRPDRRSLLDRGWFELGQRLRGAEPSPPFGRGTAVASSPPRTPDAEPPPRQPAAPATERGLMGR